LKNDNLKVFSRRYKFTYQIVSEFWAETFSSQICLLPTNETKIFNDYPQSLLKRIPVTPGIAIPVGNSRKVEIGHIQTKIKQSFSSRIN